MLSVNVHTLAGATHCIELHPTETISSLKSRLITFTGYSPNNMILTYIGTVLQDDLSLSSSGIPPNANIRLYIHEPAEFEVMVCSPDSTLVRVSLGLEDTVAELMRKIEDRIRVGPSMELRWNEKKLEDGKTIASMKMGENPRIVLWPKTPEWMWDGGKKGLEW